MKNSSNRNTGKQTPYRSALQRLQVGERSTFNKSESQEVISEVRRLNEEKNPFEFSYSTNSKGQVNVSRIIPENRYNRSLYVATIGKNTLAKALRASEGNKERTARTLGISARTVGRLMQSHGVRN